MSSVCPLVRHWNSTKTHFYSHYFWVILWTILWTTDPVQISELLAKTIGDAHSRTCLFSGEHIADMLRKPQDISKVHYYKNMASLPGVHLDMLIHSLIYLNGNFYLQAQEELWLECAQRLTAVIQQIIEFAKMVPGFMKLSQDDQIVLLKTGTLPPTSS